MESTTITSQPTGQATQPIVPSTLKPSTTTVPGQPWRTMSTVERDLPQWLKGTMQGRSANGTFSGRGGTR